MSDQPATRRAIFPADYGARGGDGDALESWSAIEDKLRAASSYWLSTVSATGRPHARPVDGVWLEGALVFGGSPDTRWVRNLQQNPSLSVHLPSGDDVVILEGDVELADPDHPLGEPSRVAQKTKYPQYYPADALPPVLPFWMFRPSVAYAWTLDGFPNGATRWAFRA
ncbi:MAG: pyridoxamine 5'-phosphate oxidase family protein [Acidimicrobiales bacterium]